MFSRWFITETHRTPTHPLAARIQQYVERLRHSLIEALDETSRKRPAPSEPTDGLSDAKRQRVNDSIPSQLPQSQEQYPPLPPGPITFAQLYTLTQDKGTTGFDVNALPLDLVIRLVPPLLASIDKAKFENAINVRVIIFHPSIPLLHLAPHMSSITVGIGAFGTFFIEAAANSVEHRLYGQDIWHSLQRHPEMPSLQAMLR